MFNTQNSHDLVADLPPPESFGGGDRRVGPKDSDPLLLVHLVDGRRLHGDLYELRIPDSCRQQARADAWWRPGRIEALLPCFQVLGVPAALVYEDLDRQSQRSWELAHTSLLSHRAAQQALVELAALGPADRGPTGWSRGSADPAAVARVVGADQLVADHVPRYTAERRRWQTPPRHARLDHRRVAARAADTA